MPFHELQKSRPTDKLTRNYSSVWVYKCAEELNDETQSDDLGEGCEQCGLQHKYSRLLHVQPVIETSRQIYSKRSAAFKKASKQVRMQSFPENKFQARSESHIIIDISETVNVCPCLQKFISTCIRQDSLFCKYTGVIL